VARILHVEDDLYWQDLVKSRLGDHHVDSARSYKEALDYLQGSPRYDLALVDLNLGSDNDLLGNEVLALLKNGYPDTRRIVITASPPAGGVRASVFRKYDVEEIIIKSDTDAPGLIAAVMEALARPSGGLTQEQRLRRSEIRQRFRDWRREMTRDLQDRIRVAEGHVADSRRVSDQSRRRAEGLLLDVKVRRVAFMDASKQIRQMLESIRSPEDLASAAEALDAAEERFADEFEEEDGTDS
jgi:CheY-like chemotaxis protein